MNLGLLFLGNEPLSVLRSCAPRAEQAGFHGLYMVEAYRSAWAPLGLLASVTEKVRLGPYVLNVHAHSPWVTGLSALDFNEVCAGRLDLGIGAGNRHLNTYTLGIEQSRTLTRLTETVKILQGMAHCAPGQAFAFEGSVHRMRWRAMHHPHSFPVFAAAVFPGMLAAMARVADGIAGGATLSPEFLRERLRPDAAASAEAAGRDPAALRWKSVLFAAVSDDDEAARAAARQALAGLFHPMPHPYYAWTLRQQGFDTVVDALERLMPTGATAEALRQIPDELLARTLLVGSRAQCAARLRDYEGLVEELLLVNVLPGAAEGVEAAWTDVMALPGVSATGKR
jgi:alkanesulfonate monooxygenase SsuD/methylene tetrahydromethanopterin reductase-like flavin-dependent oxidoreductase (luciferase family)